MDENTQKNAALVEEAAAAAESLEEQASNLRDAVAIFKLDQFGTVTRKQERKPQASVLVPQPPAPVRKALPAMNHQAVRPAATDEGEWEEF